MKLPYFFTLFWARLFMLASLMFLWIFVATGDLEILLFGAVAFYIVSVQHGSITFPRNRGGMFKRGANLSFLLMLLGIVIKNMLVYKLGFSLFVSLQLIPLIAYRLSSMRFLYDRASVVFYIASVFWALVFLASSYKKVLYHSFFIGFELNIFVACMFFMLPRFSRKVHTDIAYPTFLLSFLLLNASALLNYIAFLTNRYELILLSSFMMVGFCLCFLVCMSKYMDELTPFLTLGFLGFAMGSLFGYMGFRDIHTLIMPYSMLSLMLGMGSRWFLINFSVGTHRYFGILNLSFVATAFALALGHPSISLALSLFTLWLAMNFKEHIGRIAKEFQLCLRNISLAL